MKKNFKQFFVFLAASVMAAGFVSCSSDDKDDTTGFDGENGIEYVVCSWNGTQVVSTTKTVAEGHYTLLESHSGTFNADAVYYVVKGDVTLDGPMFLNPSEGTTCNIILTDGCHLKVNGIAFAEGTDGLTLNIYAQAGNTGCLTSEGSSIYWDYAMPAIGNALDTNGTVNIHGGTISATGSDSDPGIGTSIGAGKEINIYGGDITAKGGDWGGTGIGGGYLVTDYGTINIYGGTINAKGGSRTLTSESSAAGIGGGYKNENGTVHIYGGDITATGGHEAAGIGCGQDGGWKGAGHIIIDGGNVVARGDSYAAGIGGGDDIPGYIVEINGGHVEAYGGTDAAGIGGGEGGNGGTVTITGGDVYAEGNDNGAGIGGGEDGDGADVTITGGTVVAKTTGTDEGSRAIGPGDGSDNYGSLTLGDDLMVTSERTFTAAERKNACWYRTNVRVEPCTHPGYTAETCPYHVHE